MTVYTVPAGPLRANSYIVTENGKDAALIDCGGEEPLAFAKARGLCIDTVLLTHGPFDHIAGCAALQASGAKIGCSKDEVAVINGEENLAKRMGVSVTPFTVDFTFKDGDSFELCGIPFFVIATPGHTPGGVCFLSKDSLFTGDTLFLESVGRTDFPGGSTSTLISSVKKLFALSGDKTVYPGHDETTTLEHERKFNPYAQ